MFSWDKLFSRKIQCLKHYLSLILNDFAVPKTTISNQNFEVMQNLEFFCALLKQKCYFDKQFHKMRFLVNAFRNVEFLLSFLYIVTLFP